MLHRLLDNLDVALAVFAAASALLLAGFFLALELGTMHVVAAAMGFAACLAYLALRRRLPAAGVGEISAPAMGGTAYLVFNLAFCLLFAASLLVLYLRPELYVRPTAYFYIMVALSALLAVEILFLPNQPWCRYLVILKAIALSLSLSYSLLFLFPEMVGIDPWGHYRLTTDLLWQGQVPPKLGYSHLPMMHLVVGTTALLSGLAYKTAVALSISLAQTVTVVGIAYLLGRMMFNDKVGLLGGLVVAISGYQVQFAAQPIPNTAGMLLTPAIIYLVIKLRPNRTYAHIPLYLLLMWVLILTHTVATAVLAVFLFVYRTTSWVYNNFLVSRVSLARAAPAISGVLLIFFTVSTLTWWMYASGHFLTLISLIKWGFSLERYWGYQVLSEELVYLGQIPLSERVFSQMGFFIFSALSLIGFLLIARLAWRSRERMSLAMGGLVPLLATFAAGAFGGSILESRWWYFVVFVLAPFTGLAVYGLSGLGKSAAVRGAVVAFVVLAFAFASILSPLVNMENRAYSASSKARHGFNKAEIQSLLTLWSLWEWKIGSDWYVHDLGLLPQVFIEFVPIDKQLIEGEFAGPEEMVLLMREEVASGEVFTSGHAVYRLGYDPRHRLMDEGFPHFYSSQEVEGFLVD